MQRMRGALRRGCVELAIAQQEFLGRAAAGTDGGTGIRRSPRHLWLAHTSPLPTPIKARRQRLQLFRRPPIQRIAWWQI